ncbi:dual specificity protein phosphatase family protein [Halopseudomonas pelagia]|uniref:phosphatase domain-containing protein n=1 Tax=Halopseudomonas pelagia TaxID=553151 RepID=UPI0003A00E57|nr:dual specificity protein phosphatase family protein [Halopseudomonas pelagia]
MKPLRLLLWLSLPLGALAVVALSRPDLLRSDQVYVPAPTLHAGQARPANWATLIDPDLRLYRMGSHLFRSALPDREDLPALQAQGISTVINFYQHEDDWLTGSPLDAVHLPLHADRITDTDVIRVLRAIRDAQQHGGVLIHCKHGQNRTGVMAAMYRVIYDGWSQEQAMAEMLEGGFGTAERMSDAIGYLDRVDVAAMREAMASGACSTGTLTWCHISDWWRREPEEQDERVAATRTH